MITKFKKNSHIGHQKKLAVSLQNPLDKKFSLKGSLNKCDQIDI